MDVCLVIKERLEQLGLEQKDLAAAAEVTESYISQLLTRKKSPPAPDRTDIYEKMGKFLKLSSSRLGMPALARCAAICAPITPAPSTAAFLICIVVVSPNVVRQA